MFETICVRRQNFVGPQVMDLGFLAETLLFYGRVRLVVDAGMLAELARLCGPEALVAMVRSGRLELSYLANALAVKTENTGMVNELHTPTTFSVIGHSEMQDVLHHRGRYLLGDPHGCLVAGTSHAVRFVADDPYPLPTLAQNRHLAADSQCPRSPEYSRWPVTVTVVLGAVRPPRVMFL